MPNNPTRSIRRQILKSIGGASVLAATGLPFRGSLAASPALEDLRAVLGERLVLPTDASYDDTRRVWNAMIDRRPAAIARCASVEDVVRSVRLARAAEIPLSVRGGGHNVAGKAVLDDALMIDLGALNTVDVDPAARRARAGGGARWATFDAETARHQLAANGGTVSTTGVGGLTLGGGMGWLMRKQGLSCDHLVGAEVVTATGDVLYTSATENPDLFWALRGGGGNFGVVTALEFGLHPAEPVIAGLAVYPGANIGDMLRFFRDYTADLPDAVTAMAGISIADNSLTTPDRNVGWIGVCHSGDTVQGEALVKPVREFGPPIEDGIAEMPYLTLQSMFGGNAVSTNRNYWRSNFMTSFPDDAIELIVERAAAGMPGDSSLVLVEHMGGAIRRTGEHDTAFSNRAAEYNVSVLGEWPDAADDTANIAWTRAFGDELGAYATGAGYVNYMTGDEGSERVRSTYETNLEWLIEVKRKYDPDNVFNSNQNIVP